MPSIKYTSRRIRDKGRRIRKRLGLYEPPRSKGISTFSVSDVGVEFQPNDIEKGLAVVKRILNCSQDEFRSKQFILSELLSFGLANSTSEWREMQQFSDSRNMSLFGTLQYPTEFVDFLMECSRHKPETACEIGVYTGGSAYFAAAVLQRANPKSTYTMIDVADNLIGYESFASVLNLEKLVPSVALDHEARVFDLVFIDADHSYHGAKEDYESLGRHANMLVAFHDIHGHEYDKKGGGIVKFWGEVKSKYESSARILEFAHSRHRWMGIGVIDKTV